MVKPKTSDDDVRAAFAERADLVRRLTELKHAIARANAPIQRDIFDLAELKAGRAVEVPIYAFATHIRQPKTEHFPPVEIVIVEGILLLSQPTICERLDHSVFVDAQESVRYERRLHRDTTERGRTAEGVKKQFEVQVKPMHDQFVEPSRARADLVINGEAPLEQGLKRVLALLA